MRRDAFGVTVIMPSWNQGHWIREALESVANDPAVHEILVMDRHSTDATEEIVREYSQVRLIAADQSIMEAWWTGTEIAQTEWLVLMTTSDWCEPHAISILRDVALRHPYTTYVGAGTIVHELNGHWRLKLPASGWLTLDDVIDGGQSPGIVLYRRSIALAVGPNPLREDGGWFLSYLVYVLTHGGRARRLARPLINFRRHCGSISGNDEHSAEVHAQNALDRFSLAEAHADRLTRSQRRRLKYPSGDERIWPRARRRVARWWYAPQGKT